MRQRLLYGERQPKSTLHCIAIPCRLITVVLGGVARSIITYLSSKEDRMVFVNGYAVILTEYRCWQRATAYTEENQREQADNGRSNHLHEGEWLLPVSQLYAA